MDKQEFLDKVKEENKRRDEAVRLLCEEFAKSNSIAKVGDVVTDHLYTVKVTQIRFTSDGLSGLPTCAYVGDVLKKDLTPRKDGLKHCAWQSNIKKVNGVIIDSK